MIGLGGRDDGLKNFISKGQIFLKEFPEISLLERQFLLVGKILVAAAAAHTKVRAEGFGHGKIMV